MNASWPTGIAPLSVKDENAWLEVKPNVNWLVALPVLALPDAKPVVPPKIWVSVWLPPPTKLIVYSTACANSPRVKKQSERRRFPMLLPLAALVAWVLDPL